MLNFLPGTPNELKPKITVIGVGGAGGNAVNNMIASKLEGVDFIVANTDNQALAQSRTERRIQLGTQVTQGLGAGSRPDIGRAAAEESMDEIIGHLGNSNMVFITAGMGGGTGSGAAPVIARAARDQGILTVGVVTKPFHFEGAHRMRTAEGAIEELSSYVDTLIIIPNQNLFRIATERTTFADAFKMADDVLYSGVRGVTDLMIMPGLINLDFADIRTVMSEMGKAMMGTGEAEGDKRAIQAAEAAISNPLLDDTSMKGAKGVLINITGGLDMTLFEVDEAANRIRDEVDPEANIIFGSTFDDKLNGKMRVSVVATGIESDVAQQPKPTVISLAQAVAKPAAAPAPAFRPTVVTSQAAVAVAQPEPVVATRATAQATSAAAVAMAPAPLTETAFEADESVEDEAQVEAKIAEAVLRPEPQLRLEPSLARPTAPAAPAAPRPSFGSGDMGAREMPSLGRVASEIAATATAAAPAPRPQPSVQSEPRRTGSLFDRLMPGRRTKDEAPAAPAPAPQPAPRPMAARSETTAPRGGEDYDIPAFLRRQAN